MSKRSRELFKDKEHLVRMAGIFAIGILIFLGLQMALVPKTFGLYGHYRAAAINEEAAKPLSYAGRATCARCHGAQVEALHGGKHVTIGCEACHGPLRQHAMQPARAKASRPDATKLCATCHETNIARPKWLKQVNTAEHSAGEPCTTCHQPHAPQM